MSGKTTVRYRLENIVIPTYRPHAPDKNPMFLEKRVYQGSSGQVYPLPFTDRVDETPTDCAWQAVWLENEYVRVLILPQIGGRIHAIEDKTNGYDIIYRQRVIKPALVGLAGPWISGGIEFNWPQHHRPATFLPVDYHVEEHPDGSVTVWCSDHDPLARMKGMHGVCLHPGRSYVEVKVRAYNRTPFVQTFLWWANVAARVHEGYQSFFPPDVSYIADHAKRATSSYPLCDGYYYGVNYGARGRDGIPADERPAQFVPPHCRDAAPVAPWPAYSPHDLTWYANIATPCSYMCLGSREDFFGGYDYYAEAGLVHLANRHISPGKKQWTWGNHEFGYAWDRNLTDADGPYIELMAGVYTDNQPDFSFLQPGETKTWSHYWYPLQKTGAVQHANLDAAVSLRREADGVRLGVCVTAAFPRAVIEYRADSATRSWVYDLAPGQPFVTEFPAPATNDGAVRVCAADGRTIIAYTPRPRLPGTVPPPAVEPPAPSAVANADELYLIGLHLAQYRHATRSPVLYWQEALRRDPLDARCNNALGLWHLRRGEFDRAAGHFRRALARLTSRNPNPYDGEPYYNLGLCLRFQAEAAAPSDAEQYLSEAYDAFYKATWNQAWAAAAYHALAELDCRRAAWPAALEHLARALRCDTDNLRARDLQALVLQRSGRAAEAETLLRATLALDPLDWWARHLAGAALTCDLPTRLDLAHDYARAGLYREAIELLRDARPAAPDGLPDQSWGAGPLLSYTLGWLYEKAGDETTALVYYRRAAAQPPDYCFPARLEDIIVLTAARRAQPDDARAPYYLGNLLYDRRRHTEAIKLWETSAQLDPAYSVVWRNLGIAYFNVARRPRRAVAAYNKAVRANPADARLLYERDQLWRRTGVSPARRLRALAQQPALVRQRDDLTIELCALYNQTRQPEKALALLSARRFQPWEGGEGQALGQYVRTHLALGRRALAQGAAETAREHFSAALVAPSNLGEAKHLLANQSDLHYWLGISLARLGAPAEAQRHWHAAAHFQGDFQAMSVCPYSETTYYSARAWERLGAPERARKLLKELLAYAQKLPKTPARIDYFATSLPALLLFDDDIQFRQETTALFLQAQARLGLGQRARARELLRLVLARDPHHAPAADLLDEQELVLL